jgi:hypothetical protein
MATFIASAVRTSNPTCTIQLKYNTTGHHVLLGILEEILKKSSYRRKENLDERKGC